MRRRYALLSAVMLTMTLMSGAAMAEAVTEADAEEAVEAVTEASTEEEIVPSEVVELGVRPEYTALDHVTLGDYVDLPVEVDPIEVSDAEIDSAIESAVAAKDLYEKLTEGKVSNGDTVNIDFVGKKDDVAFDGGTAEDYELTIGSGVFIPGFEEGLVDAAIGDTVDLNLTFPENYPSEELAGADVVFTVTVNSVKKMPEVTDDLVSSLSDGEYSTVDGYREYQRQLLTTQMEEQQRSAVQGELMTQLFNTCKVNDYPQELLDYSLTEMKNYYANYAQMYNVTMDDFLANYMGMDREMFESQAETAVKQSLDQELILVAIAEQEGLADITDEEYEEGCAEYASQLGYPDVETFKENYDKEKIVMSLRMDKAMDYVRENAMITVNEPETESEIGEGPQEELTEAATE